jgi:hypothetical protein
MEELNFMVGEWIGTSRIIENGKVAKEVPAFEKISYDLNGSILVIELNSELLKLHTIIYYDEETEAYSYNPFSEKGSRKLPAKLLDGKLVVQASDTKRFIFQKIGNNSFMEYGETFTDGAWIKYFEDTFTNSK